MEGDAVIAPFFMFYSIFLKISRQKFGGIFLSALSLQRLQPLALVATAGAQVRRSNRFGLFLCPDI